MLIDVADGVIDPGWGHPSARLHPTAALASAADRVLSEPSAAPLQYGAAQRFGPFLEGLAGFLSTQDAYGGNVDPPTLFPIAGALRGVDLAATLELGLFGENIVNLRQVYGQRMDAVSNALRSTLADEINCTEPGGSFFWLNLSGGIDADPLLQQARLAGDTCGPGTTFSASGGSAI